MLPLQAGMQSLNTSVSGIQPRPYQIECVDSLFNYFMNGGRGNPFVAMPTGTGKSLIPPMVIYKAMRQWPNQRMLILTHVKELISQNHKALTRYWPTAPVGIYSAGLGLKEGYAPIVVGGIATVRNNIREIGYRNVLFVDEAQLISPNDTSMYQQVIGELRQYNPYMPVIGLSATPYRMGHGMMTDGGLFTDMVFDITGVRAFNRLIEECYLSPLIPKQTHNVIDVSDVRELSTDFNQKELCQTIAKQNITAKAIDEAWELAKDRQSWIVFGAGIENCEKIADMMNSKGISATYVHSKIDSDSRDARIQAFKEGRFRAIVSNNILTTGFDHPQVDCIVDLRPTTSVVLHVQKYGRGTRPYYHPDYSFDQLRYLDFRKAAINAGGKRNCIVLDFAGNTDRLGPINDPRIPRKKGKGTGEVPIKLCPQCGGYNHTTTRFCADCGYEFIFKTKIKSQAGTSDIIRPVDDLIEVVTVTNVTYNIHAKVGKTPKLKVVYWNYFQMYPVWLAFEDGGFPKHKAHEWFRQHHAGEIPETTEQAFNLRHEYRQAKQIKVDKTGKFPEVMEFLF